MKKIALTQQAQLDIFEEIFMKAIENSSMRDTLRKLIDNSERIDLAYADIMLAKLDLEIYKRNNGG